MATMQELRRRLRTVRNTARVTRAMELVAAAKMRRAQADALAAQPYAEQMQRVISHLAAFRPPAEPIHPLLTRRPIRHVGLLLLTTNRGLVGSLNTRLNRRAATFILSLRPLSVSLITVGRKGRDFFRRLGVPIRADFSDLPDRPTLQDVLPISWSAINDYVSGAYDALYLLYPDFVSTLEQRPEILPLLPITLVVTQGSREIDYIFEPSAEALLAQLLPRFVDVQIYHAVLELRASEQSARMVAMHAATEAANELIRELTTLYNKARQERITQEMVDILRGTAAIQPRIEHIRTILAQYQTLEDETRGHIRARVTSAVPLTADQKRRLASLLVAMSGTQVEIETVVDPSILGGLIVRLGDRLIDGSVRGRLQALRRRLRS